MSIFSRRPSSGGSPNRDPNAPLTYADVAEMRKIFVDFSTSLADVDKQFAKMQDVLRRPIPPGFTIPSEEVAETHGQMVVAIAKMRELLDAGRAVVDNGAKTFTAMTGAN